VGFKVFDEDNDPFTVATLIFRNLPNGNLLGKFVCPRLRVIYYDNSTGMEIADICPMEWWNSDGENGPTEIDADEHYAEVASFFEGEAKWTAYALSEPLDGDDPYPRKKLDSTPLPTGDLRIVAMLSGDYRKLSIPQVTGILTLREDGSASFKPIKGIIESI
jgi:hypothetical protein